MSTLRITAGAAVASALALVAGVVAIDHAKSPTAARDAIVTATQTGDIARAEKSPTVWKSAVESACRDGSYWYGGDAPDEMPTRATVDGRFANDVVAAQRNNCKTNPSPSEVGREYSTDKVRWNIAHYPQNKL